MKLSYATNSDHLGKSLRVLSSGLIYLVGLSFPLTVKLQRSENTKLYQALLTPWLALCLCQNFRSVVRHQENSVSSVW